MIICDGTSIVLIAKLWNQNATLTDDKLQLIKHLLIFEIIFIFIYVESYAVTLALKDILLHFNFLTPFMDRSISHWRRVIERKANKIKLKYWKFKIYRKLQTSYIFT